MLSGEFQAYWKYVHWIVKEERHTFEALPHKAEFDPQWKLKRIKAAFDANNAFNPFSDVEHFVWATLENIMSE